MAAEAHHDPIDLDAASFNLEMIEDEVVNDEVNDVVHNKLICDDRVVGTHVSIKFNMVDDGQDHGHSQNHHADETDTVPVPVQINEKKKRAFERRRDEILSGVPEEVKARFGKIYFSTFGKFVGPVLIMNPFKVEPGLLRDQWIHMFHNCQKSGREEQMTHLTYWYGQFNELNNAYSFQKTSQLLSYEAGMKKTEKKLTAIRQKKNSGKRLNSKELNFMHGFDEMEADRVKDPSERFGYVDPNFLEEYHVYPGEEEKNKEDTQGKEKTKAKRKSKIKSDSAKGTIKKKKIKKSTLEDKEASTEMGTEKMVENGEQLKPNKNKKLQKKRTKKADASSEAPRPKKKKKGSETGDKDSKTLRQSAEEKEGEKEKKSGKIDDDRQKGTTEDKDKKPTADEEYAGLGDVSSHGDTDDDSFQGDDSEDEKKSETEESSSKSKEPPKKKSQKAKLKIEKSAVKGEKKSTVKLNLETLHEKEQRKFRDCESEYRPLLDRWEEAINNKDVKRLSKIYDKLLMAMKNFTAPFMEEYGMGDLMKRSKGFNEDKRKVVKRKFQTIYQEKKAMVPQDFKVIKESEKYITPDAKAKPSTKTKAIVEETKRAKEMASQPESDKDGQSSKELPILKTVPQDTPMPTIPKSTQKIKRTTSSDAEISRPPSPAQNVKVSRPPSPAQKQVQPTAKVSRPPSPAQKQVQPAVKVSRPPSPVQKQSQPNVKTEKRKSFSLGTLMRPGSSSSALGSAGAKVTSSSKETSGVSCQSSKKIQTSPLWTIETVLNAGYPNSNREFAFEFLQQATLYIPESKSVNRNAIARNLETAIYNWSTGKLNGKIKHKEDSEDRWKDKYWNKIHDLAAAISGKRQRGTLAGMIAEGKFSTPDELVGLSDDELWCSFQGSPL
eukprot:jgi/Psemu1/317764/estExt_fgenesh1_pm.C_260032